MVNYETTEKIAINEEFIIQILSSFSCPRKEIPPYVLFGGFYAVSKVHYPEDTAEQCDQNVPYYHPYYSYREERYCKDINVSTHYCV